MKVNIEIIPYSENESYNARQYCDENFESPRHYHKDFELIYIESTTGKLYVGNEIINYEPKSLFLFSPQLVHAFKNRKEKGKAKAKIVLFKQDFLGAQFIFRNEAVLIKKMLDASKNGLLFSNVAPKVLRLMNNMINKQGIDGLIDLLKILHHLSQQNDYIKLCKIAGNKYFHKLDDQNLIPIFDFIEKYFAERDLYSKILAKTGKSNASFSRFFKYKTGKTFTQYLNEYRIIKAQQMLVESDLKILIIAKKCGYGDMVYFNRVFKRMNGVSPKQFRKSLRGE